MGIGILAAAIIVASMFVGCVEIDITPTLTPTPVPIQSIVTPTQQPTIQYITGNYKVQDVSGEEIHMTGNYNKINILNADVSLIRITGNYNSVYYPEEAKPVIKEVGTGNMIKTY